MPKSKRVLFTLVAFAMLCLLPVILAGCGGWSQINPKPAISMLATGGADKTITLRNKSDGTILRTIDNGEPVVSMDFSPDGKYLAVGGLQYLNIWRVADSKKVWSYALAGDPAKGVKDVKYSPDGSFILCHRNLDLSAYKITMSGETGIPSTIDMGSSKLITGTFISPSGKYIVMCGRTGDYYKVMDSSTGVEVSHCSAQGIIPAYITFTPDEKNVVIGSSTDQLQTRSVSTGSLVKVKTDFFYYSADFIYLNFLSDGNSLIMAVGAADAIQVWNYQSDTSMGNIGDIQNVYTKRTCIDMSSDRSCLAVTYLNTTDKSDHIDFFDASGTRLWTQPALDGTQAVALAF